MTDSPYISTAEIALAEMRRRDAWDRHDRDMGLSYEDIEVVFGIGKSTAMNWRSSGRLEPLPGSLRSPRFRPADVAAIVYGPPEQQPEDNDGQGSDVHHEVGGGPLGSAAEVQGRPDGEIPRLQTKNRGERRRRNRGTRRSSSGVSGGKTSRRRSNGTAAADALSEQLLQNAADSREAE